MSREPVLKYIKKLRSSVFTTRDVAAVSGKSLSNVAQGLAHLEKLGAIAKLRHGMWFEVRPDPLSPLAIIPFLPIGQRTYVSFTSALHLHGIIEQIPQTITCASVAHARTIRTSIGTYSIHSMSPEFFFGFDWYKQSGSFLIASPEKALLDCFYLAGRKKNRFGFLPELSIPESFDMHKAQKWVGAIHDIRLRNHVQERLNGIISSQILSPGQRRSARKMKG